MAGPWDVVAETTIAATPVVAAGTPRPAAGAWDVVAEAPAPSAVQGAFRAPVTADGGSPMPPEMPAPTLGDRFELNATEGFNNTMAGEIRNRVRSGQLANDTAGDMRRALAEAQAAGSKVALDSYADGKPSPYGAVPIENLTAMIASTEQAGADKGAAYEATKSTQQAGMEALPPWQNEPTLFGKAIAGGTALAGQVAGGIPSPENLVGGAGPRVARGATEGVVSHIGRAFATGAAENAAAVAATNPAVQMGQASRGEKDGFDAGEFAEGVMLGGGIGGGLKMTGPVFRALRESLSRRFKVDPSVILPENLTPDDVKAAAAADPQFAALLEANGITDRADPRVPVLEEKLAARRIEEQLRPEPAAEVSPDEFKIKNKGGAVSKEINRRATEGEGLKDGTIDPAATNLRSRVADETPIRVDSAGGAFRADEGALQGRQKAEILGDAQQRALPAPGREVLTDGEIARQRPAPEAARVETPPKLYGQEERAPQTSDQVAGQRQSAEAFTLAQAQRDRAGPNVADTQPAARPQGRGEYPVYLDEGHPVQIVNRRMVPDGSGKMTEVATVRRFDPRTGMPEADHVEYDVPAKQLQSKGYAPEPRMAQDFETRAEVGTVDKGKARGQRIDEVQGLDRQTYRQTPPDDNAAGTARASRPEQPDGPHPGKPWSNAEEAVRDFNAREEARKASGQTEPPPGANEYQGAKSSNQPRGQDSAGRYHVDESGYVMSTAKGPIRFADQMQAGKWIIGVGQKKSPDQIFEIANHPGGKGFTVRETGRAEGPGPNGPSGAGPQPERPQPRPEAPRDPNAPPLQIGTRLETKPIPERPAAPPRAEAPAPPVTPAADPNSFNQRMRERADEVVREGQNDRLKKDGTPDKRGYWHTGNEAQIQRIANETARYDVMRQEASGEIDGLVAAGRLTENDAIDIAKYYVRHTGETPDEAFVRASDRWMDAKEREGLQYDHALEAEIADAFPLEPFRAASSSVDWRGNTHYDPGSGIEGWARRNKPEVPIEEAPFDAVSKGTSENARGPVRDDGRPTGTRSERQPERGGDAAAGDRNATYGAGSGRDFASDAGPDGGRQTVIPGAERIPEGEANRRAADKPLRGGNEAPPKGGLFDEDARNQADIFDKPNGDGPKFYSNPFMDPEAWKGLGKTLGFTKEWTRSTAEWFDIAKEKWQQDNPNKTNAAADLARTYFYTTDGQLRAVGHAYESPTIKKIADLLNAPSDFGRGGAVARDFHESVGMRTQGNINKLAHALNDFRGRENVAKLEQIKKLVQNPRNIRAGSPVHDAAATIRKMLDDEWKYLRDAGVDVGKVEGYWPRMVDTQSVLRDQGGFINAAAKQYLKDGHAKNRTEADSMANAWLASIELGHAGAKKDGTDFVMLGGTPNANFAKERVFSQSIERDASNPLNRFYLKDAVDTLQTHFQRTARRAEWARRFGDDLGKWKEMKDEIIAEGNAASLRQVVDLIGSATGTQRAYHGDAARNAMSIVRTWGAIRTLSKAAFTSLAETAMPAIRSGNAGRFLPDVARTTYALVHGMKKERALAEDIGTITAAIGDSMLGRRYMAMDPGSKGQQKLMAGYFRISGLEAYTNATREVAVNMGQTLIRRLALDVSGAHTRKASSTAQLRELGIADAPAFAKWLKGINDGRPSVADLGGGSVHEEAYRTALRRVSDQTILDPNGSTRPGWANGPLGSLIFSLQSYQYAFQKNVLNRAGAGILEATTGKGYNLADRATMLAPAALLPMLVAIQYGLSPVRDAISGNDSAGKEKADPTMKLLLGKDAPSQRFMKALSQGGLNGVMDPYMNMMTGSRYDRDAATAVAGPHIGGIFQMIDSTMKLGSRNSSSTNTAERAWTKNFYDMVVAPSVGAVSALAPTPIGAAALLAANSTPAREAFMEATAGAKQGSKMRK